METHERRNIDLLVNRFWKLGFFTVYRKFGTYLPEPTKIGSFDVDIVARLKDKYAIGITISKNDLINDSLQSKLIFLATRHTRKTNQPVQLFVGVPDLYLPFVKNILATIPEAIRKNIRLITIPPEDNLPKKPIRKKAKVLFA